MTDERVTLRELLHSNFNSLNEKIEASTNMSKFAYKSLKADIERMHEKQDFTNGRVNRLENDVKNIEKTQNSCPVQTLKDKDKEQDNKIKILEEQTELIKFFEKRPKLFRLLIIAMFWSVVISMFLSFIAINEKILPFLKSF
jgi:archaellum component FlaD/FlaE